MDEIKTYSQPPCQPRIDDSAYVAESAYICGNVTIGALCTILPGVVIRGDVEPIEIGSRVNIQDGSILHTRDGVPLIIEDDVSIGHRAVVHCARVGAGSLIGIGAVVLDDCIIGKGSLIAAGAVVREGTVVPDGKLVAGVPAVIKRDVTDRERNYLELIIQNYLHLGRLHQQGAYPPWQRG